MCTIPSYVYQMSNSLKYFVKKIISNFFLIFFQGYLMEILYCDSCKTL